MLKQLTVKSFAIIEDLKVEFTNGMTVLTGQTGAGKSLIIDSISLLLGARADSDMIRYGSDKAYIEGIFTYTNPKINELLKSYSIEILNDITIYREISSNGKNIIKINNSTVTLQILKNITEYLANIHVQHDTFKLLNPDMYITLLSNPTDNKLSNLLDKYVISLDKYLKIYQEYESIQKKQASSKERLEFLEYELKELSSINLIEGIDIELSEKISKLSNYDKIFKSLNEAYTNLENEYFSLDNIYNAYKSMDKISEYDNDYSQASNKLSEAYYTLDDTKSVIYKAINSLDFDENELNSLQEELNTIESIKTKYKKNIKELIDYKASIALEIDLANNYDQTIENYKNSVITAFNTLKKDASNLTNHRKSISKDIASNIISECKDLELFDTKFEIVFNDVNYNDPFNKSIFKENGVDNVSFMISLNKGEPLKPLEKVASGGELSRIMLAFKSYFSRQDNLSLMVFDEIDSGVSGSAAMEIARKMKNIATNTQVLCITHLPQVAATSDNHIFIYKNEINGRTVTNIENLSYDRRVQEIAIMMSGNHITPSSLEMARELLKK